MGAQEQRLRVVHHHNTQVQSRCRSGCVRLHATHSTEIKDTHYQNVLYLTVPLSTFGRKGQFCTIPQTKAAPVEGDTAPTDSYAALGDHHRINNPTNFFAHRHLPLTESRKGIGATLFSFSRGVPMEAVKVMGSDAFFRYLRKHA